MAATCRWIIRLLVIGGAAWWLLQSESGTPRYRVYWDRYIAPHIADKPVPLPGEATAEPAELSTPAAPAAQPDAIQRPGLQAAGATMFAPACRVCQGATTVPCAGCGGRGTVRVQEFDPCKQCNGTGTYRGRMGGTTSPCPFCNKTGKVAREVTKPCASCGGSGRTPCAACQNPDRSSPGNAAAK